MRAFALLLFWSVVGVAASALPSPTKFDGVRMTALDVGHGGAILIEAPSGATMLFDCGSMQDDRRGAESVWHCLRGRGHASLDALVISHADLDHCNNVPALVGGGTVQNVLINRSFLKLDQHIVKEACDASLEHGSRIRLVSAGDVVRLDDSITVQVLHPTDRPPGEDDNANSLVMRVDYAGRSLLLTGDVEGSGFQELKRNEPRGGFDVVIAPHHGGLLANTAAFADWSSPKSVIVSCGDRVNEAAIREIYSNASQVYFTSRDGAIVVEVSKSGRLAIQRFGESN